MASLLCKEVFKVLYGEHMLHQIIKEIFEDRIAVVPYVMPGFELAKVALDIYEKNPHVEGLALLKHGHFTWGKDAKESYNRVVAQTNMVETWLAKKRPAFHSVRKFNGDDISIISNLQCALRRVSKI